MNEFTVNREQNVTCFMCSFHLKPLSEENEVVLKRKKKEKKNNSVLDMTSVADKTDHTM